MEVGSPQSIVTSDGYGTFPCGLLERGALGGVVSSTMCGQFTQLAKASCQCQPVTSNDRYGGSKVSSHIFQIQNGKHIIDKGAFPMIPTWKASPEPPADALLYNQMRDPVRKKALLSMIDTKLPTFAETRYPEGEYEDLMNINAGLPKSAIFFPVLGDGRFEGSVVGTIALDIVWNYIFGFMQKLPWNSRGVIMVIECSNGQSFTYQITDNYFASFVGIGDLHDPNFDSMMIDAKTSNAMKTSILKAAPYSSNTTEITSEAVLYNLRIYPTKAFKGQFVTKRPWIYTSVVVFVFVFTATMCITYDYLVRRRQTKVMQSAEQSNTLLTSLFPDFIKTRLIARVDGTTLDPKSLRLQKNRRSLLPIHFSAPKNQLRKILGKAKVRTNSALDISEPIADFFSNVTVIFADIAGFTAWSSEREPTQVFQLLETLYEKFDSLAEKHGVFKVETIGDCYVAVTGLPEPQADHAIRMVRFGHDIMVHMHELVASLESQLGPGTGSLSIRIGLHSGSVTGGVLRGDRSRFQLFGDTMNMASRMQSTGEVNKIQLSETTACLLIEEGEGRWLERRDSTVFVKGKGDMRTFWVQPPLSNRGDYRDGSLLQELPTLVGSDPLAPQLTSKRALMETNREPLVKWNTDLLLRFLKQVVAGRNILKRCQRFKHADSASTSDQATM